MLNSMEGKFPRDVDNPFNEQTVIFTGTDLRERIRSGKKQKD